MLLSIRIEMLIHRCLGLIQGQLRTNLQRIYFVDDLRIRFLRLLSLTRKYYFLKGNSTRGALSSSVLLPFRLIISTIRTFFPLEINIRETFADITSRWIIPLERIPRLTERGDKLQRFLISWVSYGDIPLRHTFKAEKHVFLGGALEKIFNFFVLFVLILFIASTCQSSQLSRHLNG